MKYIEKIKNPQFQTLQLKYNVTYNNENKYIKINKDMIKA